MTKEELIKDQFPNDEFLQSGVLRIVDKCTAELEKEKCELLGIIQGKDNAIKDLEKENAELKEKENTVHTLDVLHKEAVRKYGEVNDNLVKAKDLLKKVIKFTWGEGWNYSLSVKVEAEQFLSDSKQEE